ncbi:MAG: Holliday junction resolvase RuvX [Gammaproteobacteria bacterium]
MPESAGSSKLSSQQNARHTYLGFDFGTKNIGVAVGESVTGTARPERTLRSRNNRPDWEGIEQLIRRWQPCAVVVGIPYNSDGVETEMTARAKRFARQLNGRFGLKVETTNEHLTSMAAHSEMKDRYQTPGKADKDNVAAALILEQWLSSQ